MLITIIIFFAIAAMMGFYLLSYIVKNKNTPKGVAFTHGSLAAIGLIILVIYVLLNPSWLFVSIVIFILAAIAGVILMYRDIFGKSIPKWLAIGHGLIAVTAFVILLLFFTHVFV